MEQKIILLLTSVVIMISSIFSLIWILSQMKKDKLYPSSLAQDFGVFIWGIIGLIGSAILIFAVIHG